MLRLMNFAQETEVGQYRSKWFAIVCLPLYDSGVSLRKYLPTYNLHYTLFIAFNSTIALQFEFPYV